MKQIGWIVDNAGAIVKYEPPKAPPTRAERNAQYRIGLSRVLDLLTKAGFYCNAVTQSNTAISVQRGQLMFDVSLKLPGQIVYVTSGVSYDPKRGNATVISAADLMQCETLIQIIGTRANGSSTTPVYVPLTPELENPAQYVFINTVKVMQSMVGSSAELKGLDVDQVVDHSHDALEDAAGL